MFLKPMKPVGAIALCAAVLLVALVAVAWFCRRPSSETSRQEGGRASTTVSDRGHLRDLLVLRRVSLWDEVPMSKRVPPPVPQGPYFPLRNDKVVAFDDVVSPAECEFLKGVVEASVPKGTEQGVETRTSSSPSKPQAHQQAHPPPHRWAVRLGKECTPWVRSLEHRLAAILQTHPGKLEPLQVHVYRRRPARSSAGDDVHGEDLPHLDVLGLAEGADPDSPDVAAGQRVSTLVVFLNDLPELEEGGRAIFSKLNGGLRPKQGTAIGWNNVDPRTKRVDPEVAHTGEPLHLRKSAKYILMAYSRERAYETD